LRWPQDAEVPSVEREQLPRGVALREHDGRRIRDAYVLIAVALDDVGGLRDVGRPELGQEVGTPTELAQDHRWQSLVGRHFAGPALI
jgi:hypothetical protein